MRRAVFGLLLVATTLVACQSNRPATDAPAPEDVTPPITFPPRDGRIYATIEFIDAIRDDDLEWLRNEGFEILRVFRESNTVTVRVPAGYTKDPKAVNPRIKRVDVQMR